SPEQSSGKGFNTVALAQNAVPGTRRYTERVVYELANSIRERDAVTYAHSRRVAIYANRLARAMGWSRRAGRDLALAGLVHDLGKTWMLNAVLNKAGALSEDERTAMERHPRIAARILVAYSAPESLVEAVLHHHEAYDGHGYPDGLAGDAIPLGARVLAVADVFDVLTSSRPYKAPMQTQAARDRLLAGADRSFDPRVVAAFVHLLDTQPDFQLTPRVVSLPPTSDEHGSAWVAHDTCDE
ncbi:MAG: HD-GYP domain-containing protein, partial [Ktedonobacterales bacterium]